MKKINENETTALQVRRDVPHPHSASSRLGINSLLNSYHPTEGTGMKGDVSGGCVPDCPRGLPERLRGSSRSFCRPQRMPRPVTATLGGYRDSFWAYPPCCPCSTHPTETVYG